MVSDILIPIITAAVGYYGAYIGGKKTLEATKLSIKNEENQNRTVLMSIISHMVILIENNNDKKIMMVQRVHHCVIPLLNLRHTKKFGVYYQNQGYLLMKLKLYIFLICS